jgi:hypothetical protein
MAMIELRPKIAFSAFLTTGRADQKGQNVLRSALPYGRLSGARVARQRCPTLQSSPCSLAYFCPFHRTSLLCNY